MALKEIKLDSNGIQIAIFVLYLVPLGRPMVHVKFGANCVTNGRIMAKKRFDLTTLTCHKKV